MDNISREEVIDFYNQIGLPEQSYVRNGKIRNIYDILGIRPRLKPNGEREKTPYEILKVPPQMVMSKEVPIIFAIKNQVKKIGKYEGDDVVFTYQSRKVKKDLTLLQTLRNNYRKAIYDGDEALAYRILQMYDKLTDGKGKEFADSFYDYSKFYRRMKKQLLIDLFAHFFLMQEEKAQMEHFRSVKYGVMGRGRRIKPYRNREFYGVPSVTEEDIEEYERRQAEIQAELNRQNEQALLEQERQRREQLERERRARKNQLVSPWFVWSPRQKKDDLKFDYEIKVKKNPGPAQKRKRFFDWRKLGRIFGIGQKNDSNVPQKSEIDGHLKGLSREEIERQMMNPEITQEELNYLKNLNLDINDNEKSDKVSATIQKTENEVKQKEQEVESEASLERHLDFN